MSKSAAKNETLIFIRSLPFSVSAYDIGNNRATPFRAMRFITIGDQKVLRAFASQIFSSDH